MPERTIGLRGERLARLRDQRGWTQLEAGVTCGVPPGNLSRMERGDLKNITISTLAGLAKGYETTIEYLIGITNDPAPYRRSPLDDLTSEEAEWLGMFQELSVWSRETIRSMCERLRDRDRQAVSPSAYPVRPGGHQ